MKLIRYKNLSQFIDTQNLYTGMDVLGEVFMMTEEYFVFLKKKTSNEVWMTKETFAGGFRVVKIPFQTWGITVDRFNLLKSYSFGTIGVNLICAQVNGDQYVTILTDDADHIGIWIDSTSDAKGMNFMKSACPLTVTKIDTNWTIHSYNNSQDGSNSTMLFNTLIDWTSTFGLNPVTLSSVLSTTSVTPTGFNLLISDAQSTNLLWIYSMTGGSPTLNVRDLNTLQAAIFNQLNGDATNVIDFGLTSLGDYVASGLSDDLVLVNFNNNTMIYYNQTNGKYYMKNIHAYCTRPNFTSVEIFKDGQTKFNIFKQMLVTFNDVTDVSKYRLGKAVVSSNMFLTVEANLSLMATSIYKPSLGYFSDTQQTQDIFTNTGSRLWSTLSQSNYSSDPVLPD